MWQICQRECQVQDQNIRMERAKIQDARIVGICVCWSGVQCEFIVQALGKSVDLSITKCSKTSATKDSVLLDPKHLDLCLEKMWA